MPQITCWITSAAVARTEYIDTLLQCTYIHVHCSLHQVEGHLHSQKQCLVIALRLVIAESSSGTLQSHCAAIAAPAAVC